MSADAAAAVEMAEGGEALSKNEQKRRAKLAEKEKEKAEKAAAKAAAGEGAKPKDGAADAADAEEEMDAVKYLDHRTKMIASWAEKGVSAYPHKFHVSMEIPAFIAAYAGACTSPRPCATRPASPPPPPIPPSTQALRTASS